MLVLSRRPGERIVLPQLELAVTVLGIEGNAVRLGIVAPQDVAVYREEVWQQLCQETHGPPPKGQGAPVASGIAGRKILPARRRRVRAPARPSK
jgi:carbon storage regulator